MGKFDKRNERDWQWGYQPRKSFKAVDPVEAEKARQRSKENELMWIRRRETEEAQKEHENNLSNEAYGIF